MVDVTAQTIFCDDIRQESNGKYIIIGTYSGEILIYNSVPLVQLATYVSISGLSEGPHSLALAVQLQTVAETRTIGNMTMEVQVTRPDLPAVIAPTGLHIPVDADGLLTLYLSVSGSPPKEAGHLKIKLISPNASPDQVAQ
jgi:hypothetical protein